MLIIIGSILFAVIPMGLLTFRWELHNAEIFHYSPKWNLYAVLYFIMLLMFQFTGFSFLALAIANQAVK